MDIILLIHLFNSHIIADFLLQPKHLIEYKEENCIGVLLHVCIICLILILFLYPYLTFFWVWVGILFIGIIHFIEDNLKICANKRHNYPIFFFFVDQVVHIITILIGFRLMQGAVMTSTFPEILLSLYTNIWFILFIMVFSFGTFTFDIVWWIINIHKHPVPYKRDWFSMAIRGFIISVVYWGTYVMIG